MRTLAEVERSWERKSSVAPLTAPVSDTFAPPPMMAAGVGGALPLLLLSGTSIFPTSPPPSTKRSPGARASDGVE